LRGFSGFLWPANAKLDILGLMFQTRTAAAADAALITAHRTAMFTDMGRSQKSLLDAMSRNFEPWVTRMIIEGKYAGWITESDGRPVASAGFFVLDWPPHPLDPAGEHRGYLLNVFVEPEFRRRGLAHALVDLCITEAHRRQLRVVALHSSDAARPIYDAFGFRASSEMLYMEPVEG
jgi:ribosomal protein S18 acetylase RimI-like enzyme